MRYFSLKQTRNLWFRLRFLTLLALVAEASSAPDRSKIENLSIKFSASLSVKMTILLTKKAAFSVTTLRSFELLCLSSQCFLGITSIAAEYCDGRSKPANPTEGGIDYEFFSNYIPGTDSLTVEKLGKDMVLLKFRDNVLWGPTEESIIVNYKDRYPVSGDIKMMTQLKGSAVGIQAATQESRSANYSELTSPTFCLIGFWPLNQ